MDINATLIGQLIWFLLFIILTKLFIWPPILKALSERQHKIAEGLAAAEQSVKDQQEMQRQSHALMQQSRKEAADIIAHAHKQNQLLLEEARHSAQQEHDRIVADAQIVIAQEVTRAREHLRGQVADLALAAASKILKREVDPKAHSALLEDLRRAL